MTLPNALVTAVGGSLLLAAGSSLVSLKVNDASQDQRIDRLEHLQGSVDDLQKELQRVDGKLEHLDGKLDSDERHEPRQ